MQKTMKRREWLKSVLAVALGAAMEVMPDLTQIRPNKAIRIKPWQHQIIIASRQIGKTQWQTEMLKQRGWIA